MIRLLAAAAKWGALAAFLVAASACTQPAPLANAPYLGGAWPGWQNIDEGGFEELGRVTWHTDAVHDSAFAKDPKGIAPIHGLASVTPPALYQFYPLKTGLARFCPPRAYVPLILSGNVTANRIVLDQASITGGMVHISGRQRSGLWPGGAYVEVERATLAKRPKRIAW